MINWHSPRFFLPLIVIFIVVIVGVVFVYIRSTSTDITIAWQPTSPSFSQQEQQDIQTAMKSVILAPNPQRFAGHEFTIIDAQRQGDWAIFSANERVGQNTQPIAGEPIFFLANRQGTTWTVWLPSSSGFCDHLKQIPDTLLNPTDKAYFC